MKDHTTTVTSSQSWDAGLGVYVHEYKAVCAGCRWQTRRYPLDERRVVESHAQTHRDYHASVARLTASADREPGT